MMKIRKTTCRRIARSLLGKIKHLTKLAFWLWKQIVRFVKWLATLGKMLIMFLAKNMRIIEIIIRIIDLVLRIYSPFIK